MEPTEAPDLTAPPTDRDRSLVIWWCIAAVGLLPTPIWLGDLLARDTGWRFGVAIVLGVILGRLFPTQSAGRWLEHVKRKRS